MLFFVNGNAAAATLTGIMAGAKFYACNIEIRWLFRVQITSPEGGNPSPYHKAHPSPPSSQLAEAATDSKRNMDEKNGRINRSLILEKLHSKLTPIMGQYHCARG